MRHYLGTDEILEIYKKHKEGKTYKKIAAEMGIKWTASARAIRIIESMLLNKKSMKKVHKKYRKAYRVIVGNGVTTRKVETQPTQEALQEDPFDRLNKAFVNFTNEMGRFIEEMMNKRAKGVLTELHAQREANKQLIDAIENAKNANWITSLKSKFKV